MTCDSNFLSAEDISPLTTKSLKFTVSCKSNRPSELWSQALQVGLPQGYTRVVVGAGMVCACTKNNGLVNLASTYFTVEDNKTLYSSEMRRDVLSLYDETKGYADNFGHLVKAYYPDVKFRNYEFNPSCWLDDLCNHECLYPLQPQRWRAIPSRVSIRNCKQFNEFLIKLSSLFHETPFFRPCPEGHGKSTAGCFLTSPKEERPYCGKN